MYPHTRTPVDAGAAKGASRPLHIAYLLTTFPCVSETFIQRELRVLRSSDDIRLDIHSLWKGAAEWEGHPVNCFPPNAFCKASYKLPALALRFPRAMSGVMDTLLRHPPASRLNCAETLAGLGFAMVMAHGFRQHPPDWIHAGWATMPATAAWALHRLCGIPFSMGAHAYDIFQWGGDCLLDVKLAEASLVHTTTEYARRRLVERGADPAKVTMIRRGMDAFPPFQPPRPQRSPLRLISAGRFVEKKGWLEQLHILAACKQAGLDFSARIIGDGPMATSLGRSHARLGLADCVSIEGWLSPAELFAAHAASDVCLFTGKIAADGDRDGLPNVIPEAMACGRLVLATPVAGVPEAIEDGTTGFLCTLQDTSAWVRTLQRIQTDTPLCLRVAQHARQWVRSHYDNRQNTLRLTAALRHQAATYQFKG